MEDITVFFVDVIIFCILFYYNLKILFNPLVSQRSAVTRLPCDADPKGILSWIQALPGLRHRRFRVLICFLQPLDTVGKQTTEQSL